MNPQNPQGGYLPVPTDYILDQRTVDPSLPASNQVVIQVDAPPQLQQDLPFIVGMLRYQTQKRLEYSTLHLFMHNLWSQNFYQNEIFAVKVQQLVDAVEYYMTVRSMPGRQAIEQASVDIYLMGLVATAGEYPVIYQNLPQHLQQQLVETSQQTQSFYTTLQGFVRQKQQSAGPMMGGHQQSGPMMGGPVPGAGGHQQGARMAPGGHGGGPMGHQQPMGHHQQPMGGGGYTPGQMAVGGQAHPGGPTGPVNSHAGASTPSGRGGRYAEPAQPTQPTTWSADDPVVRPTVNPQEAPHMTTQAPLDTQLPVPTTLDDIVLDPYYYVPDGANIAPDRPWDHFYAPGGIEIQPAHASDWTWTQGSEQRYPSAADPLKHMVFLVKFPEGVVKEWIVERVDTMDYLAHELVGSLRTAAVQRRRGQDGLVVPDVTNHAVYKTSPEGIDDVKDRLTAGDVETINLPPVVVEEQYTASSMLENEEAVREDIAESLELTEDDPLPAHIYPTATVYPIHVSGETARNTLIAFATADTLPLLADAMVEALNDGVVSSRYIRFLNERLTRMVNQCLVDHLALMGTSIDNFIEDIADLYEYLEEKQGPAVVAVFESKTPNLLKRWLAFTTQKVSDGETTREEFCLVDYQINYQTAFEYAEVAALHLTEIPSVVDRNTHPNLYHLATTLAKTAADLYGEDAVMRTYRLISVDGVYLQMARSWYDNNTLLIKRLET